MAVHNEPVAVVAASEKAGGIVNPCYPIPRIDNFPCPIFYDGWVAAVGGTRNEIERMARLSAVLAATPPNIQAMVLVLQLLLEAVRVLAMAANWKAVTEKVDFVCAS